jgi:tRNA (cmo5U34)-methyltransferase
MLAASLGSIGSAKILVVGAGGTAQEIIAMAKLEPDWRFTAVDPSEPMLEAAKQQLETNNLLERTAMHLGYVEDLAADESYDAATLIGVLHHLEGDDAKRQILRSVRAHLKPGAPLIVAGNHYAYASQPLLLAAWGQRWRQHGASPDEVKVKLGKILQGADPPHSEEVVQKLLHDAGFGDATRFFSSLFWGAWLTCKTV